MIQFTEFLFIAELFSNEEELRELNHLSTGRKRKQIVIPLIAASERGRGRTESYTVRLWSCGVSALLNL